MKILLFLMLCLTTANTLAEHLRVLTYHDISAVENDDYAVSRSNFVAHMDYLLKHGYQPVSLAFLDAVKAGRETLPAKPVLLTFDDGLASYHDFVVPLLDIYQFPSIGSIVTAWLDDINVPEEYGDRLMTWQQLKVISENPLVEIISHSHNLHFSVPSNPQGNVRAASITRSYFHENGTYESEALFFQRIQLDLNQSVTRLEQELGKKVRGIAWPYGYYNQTLSNIASNLRLDFQFTLDDGPTPMGQLPVINRIILFSDTNLSDLENELQYRKDADSSKRFVEIQLDPLLNQTPEQRDRLLSNMLDRLEALGVNMVILSPLSQDLSQAFFPNDEFELAEDLFNRVIHLIQDKLPVRFVFVKIPENLYLDDAFVFYQQLARLNRFNGIVFSEDMETEEKTLMREIFDFHQPHTSYASYQPLTQQQQYPGNLKHDITLYQVRTGQLEGLIKHLPPHDEDNNTLVLLEPESNANAADITQALRTLRDAGFQHYGYGPLDYVSTLDRPTQLVKELNAPYTTDGGG